MIGRRFYCKIDYFSDIRQVTIYVLEFHTFHALSERHREFGPRLAVCSLSDVALGALSKLTLCIIAETPMKGSLHSTVLK